MEKRVLGKVIYRPPERAFTNVWLVETDHGYKVFLKADDARPKAFIPHGAIKQIEYRDD